MKGVDPAVLRVARAVGRRLAQESAEAVVLAGSWVRGDAHRDSDVDIIAIGRGSHYGLERRDGLLISISWQTVAACRREFRLPAHAGGTVPAWRRAVVLHDPRGTAKALKLEARAWTWEVINSKCDGWVAEELTGWAEEVYKMAGGLRVGRRWAAAVQRSLLSFHMAPIVAVHRRMMYDTENRLWDLVGEAMGAQWRRIQDAAFGSGGEGFEETCAASLELYRLTAAEVWPLLDGRQRAVVAHACDLEIPGFPSGRLRPGPRPWPLRP